MHKKILPVLSAVLIAGLVFSACKPFSKIQEATASPTPAVAASVEPVTQDGKKQANYEFTATEDGQIALDLIQANAEIKTQDYGTAGKFVTSINGLEGSNEYYWAFYLNGKYAEQGASQTKLKKGDTIKFVYEAVSLTK